MERGELELVVQVGRVYRELLLERGTNVPVAITKYDLIQSEREMEELTLVYQELFPRGGGEFSQYFFNLRVRFNSDNEGNSIQLV